MTPVVEMRGITKSFGPVQALRGVDLMLSPGEVCALLGENGAGKTTLMLALFGMVAPDAGTIDVRGRRLPPGSPREAMSAGIGMVHQHFSQVPRMTVAENVWLGRPGLRYDRRAASAAVMKVGADAGLILDPDALAGDLPVGLRQRLEIVKALAGPTQVLILDEPTGALTPSEVTALFAALRRLAASGLAIVLITHKLREAAAIADRVTVLRQGRVALTGAAGEFDAAALTAAMIGEVPSSGSGVQLVPDSAPALSLARAGTVLAVRELSVRDARGVRAVTGVSFDLRAHEIVGIAAVEGNGQRELMRAVAGLVRFEGTVTVVPGTAIGFIPEDRQHEGLILDFPIAENLALAETHGFWLHRDWLENRAAVAMDEFDIRATNPRAPVRTLSGGNQQRVVLARVLGGKPALLVAENPTRGLDIGATADVHAALRRAARDDGVGVLFHSTDLDEVLALSDRIAVMNSGRWRWVGDEQRSRESLGALMLGAAA